MKFTLAFIIGALAGSSLAHPSSLQSSADGKENVKLLKRADVEYSSIWAGVVQEQPSSGYFTSVTGRFTVPNPKYVGSGQYSAGSAWAGIDGWSCQGASIQAGLDWRAYSSGEVTYHTWYRFSPDHSWFYSVFNISPGDVIQIDVTVTSTTRGSIKLTNVSTGGVLTQEIKAPEGSQLCRENAEWIVKNSQEGDAQISLADFGTVVFTEASAGLSTGGSENLSGAATVLLRDDSNTVYTDVVVDSGSQFTVKYIPGGRS
jgi:Peptidase A4 family